MRHESRKHSDACPDFVGWLARAADDDLTGPARASLDAHLATCAACAASLETQRAARAAVAGWAPVGEVSPDFTRRVMAAIGDAPRVGEAVEARDWLAVFDFRRWTWRLAPLAAGLALVAGMTVSQSTAALAEASPVAADAAPVSSAIWSESVSESELVSLWLTTDADAQLVEALEEVQP